MCFSEDLLGLWVAEPVDDKPEADQDTAGSHGLAVFAEKVDGLLERLPRLPQPASLLGRQGPALEQRGTVGMACGSELERASEVVLGAVDVEPERALAGQPEVADGALFELCGVSVSGGAREVERLQVVVGEHVRQVLDAFACFALDPGGRSTVTGGTRGARDLRVADVSHEDVPEAVLGLAFHRGDAGGANELLAGELVQSELDFARLALSHLGDSACPEDLAKDCGVLEQALPLRRHGVEAGRDERVHRVGYVRGLTELTAIREQAHELLGVEGIAARALEQGLLRLRGKQRSLQKRRHEAGRSLRRSGAAS